MVKKSVTLLEETIFQHVTIHKLMIYLYNKIKMSQDPLLAVIRTNIVELKNMARDDPRVIIASSKTVLKTLLNFTRLTCINKETVCFIRRLMHDVYARMKRLWEIYKAHGSYELPKGKRFRISNKVVDKENVEAKNSSLKITIKQNTLVKKVSDTDLTVPVSTEPNDSSSKDIDDADDDNSVIGELDDDSFNESILNEQTKSIVISGSGHLIDGDLHSNENVNKTSPSKGQKKRKIKKWSLGNFNSGKRKRKRDNSKKSSSPKTPPAVTKTDTQSSFDTPIAIVLPEEKLTTPSVATPPSVVTDLETAEAVEAIMTNKDKSIVPEELMVPAKKIEYEDLLIDKGNSIVKDGGWGERLRIQREFYLNEMYKVTQKLNLNKSPLPKYDFINKVTNKLGVTLTTYGYSLKELMAMDHANLVKSPGASETMLPTHTDWTKMEASTSAIVSIFKATRCKKRFLYECLGEGCSIKTTQLQDLHNHASMCHLPFEWNWSCSLCGTIEVNFLRSADLLDMAMYHLMAFHSSSALNRNPVELEFHSLELQMRNKLNLDSPVGNHSAAVPEKNINYYSHLYKCAKCNFSSVLLSEAYSHFYQELNISDSKELNCIYCLKSFMTVESLCDHLELYHASSIFLCSKCHYRSVSFYNTLNHFYDDHDDGSENMDIIIYVNNPPLNGKDFPPTYYPPEQLTKFDCAHPDNDNFYTFIGSKFTKHISNCHLRSGFGKKYECSICKAKIGNAHNLKQHYETHQISKYMCTYCGQNIAKLPAIKEHLYTFHMNYHPRFIIREAFDDCPEEISSQYTSLMRYETPLEDLIEVSIEMNDFEKESSRIKLQTVSGESFKNDNLLDQLNDIYSKTKLETNPFDIVEVSNAPETPLHRIKIQHSISESIEPSNEDDSLVISSDSDDTSSNHHYPLYSRVQYVDVDPLRQMDISIPSTSSTDFIFPSSSEKSPLVSKQNNLLVDRILPSGSSTQSVSVVIPFRSQISDSPASPTSPSNNPLLVTDKPRPPEIRVIAAAKMDNFRKSLPGVDDLVNLPKEDFSDKSGPSRASSGDNEKHKRSKTVPRILGRNLDKSKKRMIQICSKNNFDNLSYCIVRCPFCEFAEGVNAKQAKMTLSQHLSRNHVDVLNFYSDAQTDKSFQCAKCDTQYEAFAALHKHFDTDHKFDSYGTFKIYLRGKLFVRKTIRVCFLCSALIVSLEELYKHPDNCPFAHTTGTPLNSSIVYATDKDDQIFYTYEKSEVKVNKAIVELLQPHLPSTSAATDVIPVKRAVAKKSTGPRPLPIENIDNSPQKRAVAKKSTGPYVIKLN